MSVEQDIIALKRDITLIKHRLEDAGKPGEATLQTPLMISPWSKPSLGIELAALATPAPTDTIWPAANRAIGVPFVIDEPVTVQKMFWYNGGSASNNACVGIYNENFALQRSSGSIAIAGVIAGQDTAASFAPIILVPGRYYMAMAVDSVVPSFLNSNGISLLPYLKMLGMWQMAAAFPLPAVITPALVASAYLPYFGLSLRTLVTS